MRWKNKCKYYDERKFYENWNFYTGDKVFQSTPLCKRRQQDIVSL